MNSTGGKGSLLFLFSFHFFVLLPGGLLVVGFLHQHSSFHCRNFFVSNVQEIHNTDDNTREVWGLVGLVAVEEELVGVLAVVVVRHGIGGAELPVFSLEALNQCEIDGRAAKVVAELLAKVDGPVVGVLVEHKLRGLFAGAWGR